MHLATHSCVISGVGTVPLNIHEVTALLWVWSLSWFSA